MGNFSDNEIRTCDADQLDRKKLVLSLREVLSGNGLMTPMTVGVYGGWGTGKTSLMRMLRSELAPAKDKGPLTLWFDAWKYARSDESLWRALLLKVVEALGDEDQGLPARMAAGPELEKRREEQRVRLDRLQTSLYRSQTWTETGDMRVNWRATLPFAADLALRFVGLSEKLGLTAVVENLTGEDAEAALSLIEREQVERHREQVTSLDQFQATLTELVRDEIVERGLRLFIFIDDLDRCLPEDAVAALEAVKLFLDLEGCVFILGMDRDVVERGILARYPPVEGPDGSLGSGVDPRQYLDKIIQLPLSLPPLTREQIGIYLDDLLVRAETHSMLESCRSLIEAAAPSNPRTVKRLLNVLSLLLPLGDNQDMDSARYLAKVVLIQVLFDQAYAEIVRNPERLKDFERVAEGLSTSLERSVAIDISGRLKALLNLDPKFAGLDENYLTALVAQTAITDPRAAS